MTLDLTKLTPAPWHSERRYSNGCEIVPRIHCEKSKDRECGWIADLVGAPYLGYESTLVNAEFIALARNAFDVMMRRGWSAIQQPDESWGVFYSDNEGGGLVVIDDPGVLLPPRFWPDPFTALIEADKWYREHIEVEP